jgi:SOS-response transcriptional repressor LexA
MQNLTLIEQETLFKIHQLCTDRGYMPTQRELARSLNLSHCAIQGRVANLKAKGYLTSIAVGRDRNLKFGKLIEFEGKQIPVLGTVS